MCYFQNNNQREIFVDTIKQKLVGPGGEELGYDPSVELLSVSPLRLYYSGIIYPKNFSPFTDGLNDDQIEDDLVGPLNGQAQVDDGNNGNFDDGGNTQNEGEEESNDLNTRFQSFYPNNCGISFNVKSDCTSFILELSFARYEIEKGFKMMLTDEEHTSLVAFLNNSPQRDNVNINRNGLETNLAPGGNFNLEQLKQEFKAYNDISNFFLKNKLYKLLFKPNKYRRKPYLFNLEIDTNDASEFISDNEKDIKYHIKVINFDDKKFIKILVSNESEGKKAENCFFQVKLKVESPQILPYENRFANSIDSEREIIDFQYRKLEFYGKGTNVAVDWGQTVKGNKYVETTYLPQTEINSFSNATHESLGNKNLDWIFELKNLSIWTSKTENEILQGLEDFVKTYHDWIETQDNTSNVGITLIEKQVETKNRLHKNINYLRENKTAYNAFKLANTAMLIQMIIARNPAFAKGRDYAELNGFNADNLDFFINFNQDPAPAYRPFQLAFLLMNVEPTFEKQSTDRVNNLDLIWFPTGGGKTEAYLALTALSIIERKIRNNDAKGVSVIMRYTLRLLTAQQFERATMLICALEFLRTKLYQSGNNILGTEKITIGMWVGKTTTPNDIDQLGQHPFNILLNSLIRQPPNLENCRNQNRFPLSYCPWCGCNLISHNHQGILDPFRGFSDFYNSQSLKCINNNCYYHGQNQQDLPVLFIDEQIYNNPPTLLFATVDKMVQLSHKFRRNGNIGPWSFFDQRNPPDLIIQDELHLLTGPLGTSFGLYEVLIDQLTSTNGYKPKLVASTATTRNTPSLVKKMFNRDLNVFPPLGTEYTDSFFSFIDNNAKRKHLGILPTGHSMATAEIKLVAAIYEAKIKLLKQFLHQKGCNLSDLQETVNELNSQDFKKLLDPYWTLVLYYNSLKDLGRAVSKVGADFRDQIEGLFRENDFENIFTFVSDNHMVSRTPEFTSRQESSKIKALLSRIATPISFEINQGNNQAYLNESDENIDMALATNMFSVGIDVPRLNLMIMLGQPGSVAEYIQASSRVAREVKGLVVNVLNPLRSRELSIFEDFIAFHKAYYKNVEPLSITPFTQMVVDKLLAAVYLGFVYQKKQLAIGQIPSVADIQEFKNDFNNRGLSASELEYIENRIDAISQRLANMQGANFNQIRQEFEIPTSLHDIDKEVFIKNINLNY